ncbi:MAG TPA: right-handed parallel beta-helix repeat-containing protein [Myxococcaceae bacterium]|nr:right-handed parallel beta-helix repeat-containing protein [Myxococcaceae bacterium]
MRKVSCFLYAVACAWGALGCGEGTLEAETEEMDSRSSEEFGLVSTAGAQATPDTAYAGRNPTTIFHVAVGGNDNNPGTSARPWRTLTKAVRTLTAGQGAYVHAGTYSEHVSITSRDGTAAAPIFLMGAPGEAKPVIRATSAQPVVRISRAYWVVDGFDVNANGQQAHGIRLQGARNVTVRNCLVHNGTGPGAIPVFEGASDIWLYRNKVYDYRWYVNGRRQDSHGFFAVPDARRVLIQENEAYNMSGDGFQCAGVSEVGFGTANPQDITLEDNRFHHNAENAIDIKSCSRVTIRGGAKDGSKFFGHRPADDTGTHCAGAAIVIHYNASQILVERSRFWDNGIGVTVGRDDKQARDVIIRHNLFFGINTVKNGCGDGVRIAKVKNVSVYNNTFDGIGRSAVRVGVDNASTLSEGVGIWNNIMRNATHAVDVSFRFAPALKSDRNLVWGGNAAMRMNSKVLSLSAWKSQTGLDGSSQVADPKFVSDPASQDYYTQGGSPARDRAMALASSTYCGSGQDLGFLESCE